MGIAVVLGIAFWVWIVYRVVKAGYTDEAAGGPVPEEWTTRGMQ